MGRADLHPLHPHRLRGGAGGEEVPSLIAQGVLTSASTLDRTRPGSLIVGLPCACHCLVHACNCL